jgi:Eco57I restriction-modification methylase
MVKKKKLLWDEQALQVSLYHIAEQLVEATQEITKKAKTEEDLRIGFEKLLEPLLKSIEVTSHPKYEKSVLQYGRSDAVHGQVIIEYESPRSFRKRKSVEHAYNQLMTYIEGEAQQTKDTLFLFDPKFVGVGFDGETIFFVRYRGDKDKPKLKLHPKDFIRWGPYPFDSNSARTLLAFMRALSRRLLTAENLAEVFGPTGTVAKKAVSAFTDALLNWRGSPRVRTFFDEWRRLFGIVYGEHFGAQEPAEAARLSSLYGVESQSDFQELLFSVHTYFVLLMKLIAAELLTISETKFMSSFSEDLAHSNAEGLREKLADVENGGVYARKGITNFLEGDFFRWYLDALSPQLEEAIRDVARSLSEFEPATVAIDPASHRDLLKKLYQYLVPKEIRHNLGEYYTPDWLAELVLKQAGYRGDSRKRVLDPACGSGTFLVLAIHKAKEKSVKTNESPRETAKRIVANIWGFDLNPLAVIAARTNYLFALGDLVHELPDFEIPVYLADSVLWPEKAGQMHLNFAGGDHVKIPTSVGEFHVPSIWVVNAGFLMKRAAPLIEQMIKNKYQVAEALEQLKKEGMLFPPHEQVVANFYEELVDLEAKEKNGIWARFLKNVFAPMAAGRFDYVVGNPPWIRWGYLSQEYRNATLHLWKDYGLFSLKGSAARLGGGEKDFSMLFTYAAIDFYVEKKGILAFLITQEVYKSKGAGEGFRRFRLGDKESFKVLQAHDLVTVQPFEGAANKTAMMIVRKGPSTSYPVSYTLWSRKRRVGKIPTDFTLEDALPLLEKKKLQARPIGKASGSWQTLSSKESNLSVIEGNNAYQARRGASTEPYGVFWIQLEDVLSANFLHISNLHERGKRKIPKVYEKIEKDLVFPAVSGADIQRWGAEPGVYILMVQDPQKCKPYPESEMKQHWPRTFSYLTHFKEILLTRGSKTVRQLAERTAFYAMFGIGSYTVARYKVVWKRMASDLIAAVISTHKTPFGHKIVIPTDTTSLFATDSLEEAHYICAIINSTPVREFIKSYSSGGRGFGAPSVMQHVGIPNFDKKNKLHKTLSDLSKKLHSNKSKEILEDISPLDNDLNNCVNNLFNLKL